MVRKLLDRRILVTAQLRYHLRSAGTTYQGAASSTTGTSASP